MDIHKYRTINVKDLINILESLHDESYIGILEATGNLAVYQEHSDGDLQQRGWLDLRRDDPEYHHF